MENEEPKVEEQKVEETVEQTPAPEVLAEETPQGVDSPEPTAAE